MDSGSGARRGNGGGGGGRGNPNWRKWMYKKRGGGSGGDNNNAKKRKGQTSGESTASSTDYGSHSPPVPKKQRSDNLQNIRSEMENQWKSVFPGYELYYRDPPQLSEIKEKVAAISLILHGVGIQESAHEYDGGTVDSFEGKIIYPSINYTKQYHLEVDEILESEEFRQAWPNFEGDLFQMPEEVIKIWSATAHKVVHEALMPEDSETSENDSDYDSEDDENEKLPSVGKIQVGFFKSKPITPVIDIKSELAGKFVTIKGAVVRLGNPRIYCPEMVFRCKVCEKEFSLQQDNGCYTPPSSCPAEACRNASLFEPLENSLSTIALDCRHIRIQDSILNAEKGSMPRTVECLLLDELTEKCVAGDVVSLSGIVKVSRNLSSGGGSKIDYSLYIEVSSIKQHNDSERTMGGNIFSFSDMDYYFVKAVHETPDLFRFLLQSLCPSIYGHELVKVGLLLSLFGGTARDGFISRRSDINMLMVGDPGIGKSQMLKVVSEVAPRAVYVCGSGSTVAGLTVTVVRDGDETSLEAGALVLANKGVCCIDEFDKMPAQHNALLEAMEQQSVSIAKSGIFRTLPARTTVIAAANPVGGHYNVTKTVSENIKIASPLLSRFDLIFIILDKPDTDFDRKVFEHVRNFRKAAEAPSTSTASTSYYGPKEWKSKRESNSSSTLDESQSLIEYLKPREGEVFDLLPHSLLRKYIAYARQWVHPKVTPEAGDMLREYYQKMRKTRRGIDSTPVTSRQLESLVRLTEARAKLELREEATVRDAKDVIEIYECTMTNPFKEDVFAVSALSESILLGTASQRGSKKSSGSNAKKLMSSLQTLAKSKNSNILSVDEIKDTAAAIGLRATCDSLIAALNTEGVLLSQGGHKYKLRTIYF